VKNQAPSPAPIQDEILAWLELPKHPSVFALGCFARQVTFASQQTRALNLVWALFKTGRLVAGQRVAVIGAGLAGLTAVVAALTKGCAVDLFDQASQPCPVQRGSDNRFIHPNILRWPDPISRDSQTQFPFLNWSAASSRSVIRQIELQWEPFTKNPLLERYFNYKVDRVYASSANGDASRPSLAANRVIDGRAVGDESRKGKDVPGYFEKSYDAIILATGFGDEREIAGVPLLSYWENDSFHQEIGRQRRSILVSGCGDGGLIDALRLRLRNFDHADFTRQFLELQRGSKLPRFIRDLQKIDDDLRPFSAAPDLSLRFKERYGTLGVPRQVRDYFLTRSRSDTRVTLNSPAAGPLTFGSSLLNRYATYLAMVYADLRYLSGRISARRVENGCYAITLEREGTTLPDTQQFDLVIVRHGPKSVITNFASDAEITELATLWKDKDDPTIASHWRRDDDGRQHGFFREAATQNPLPTDVVVDLAWTTFDSMHREFYDPKTVQSVSVGEHDGVAGFIVTLRPYQPPRDAVLWANVPVRFVVAAPAPSTGRLPVGAGIYNYTAREREKKRARSGPDGEAGDVGVSGFGPGTLGCFATNSAGKTFLIAHGDTVGAGRGARIGDQIFLEGQSPETGHQPIARLSEVYTIPDAGKQKGKVSGTLSIVAAQIERHLVPDFGPLPSPWRIERARKAESGRVVKIGRTSGFTEGKIDLPSLAVVITSPDGRQITVSDCISVKGKAKADFSRPGDGGAAVVHEKGDVIGIVVAGSEGSGKTASVTIVYPIDHVLKGWKMRLLPGRRSRGKSAGHAPGPVRSAT
jgi:hypothetical protein